MIFEWNHGLIWVSIKINYNGAWYLIDNCIIDTGSATTAIDIDLIDFDYKRPAKIKRLLGVGGGSQEVVSQRVDTIMISQTTLSDIEIEFGDLQEDLGINGFIGTDILSQFILTLNFAKKTLNLIPHG